MKNKIFSYIIVLLCITVNSFPQNNKLRMEKNCGQWQKDILYQTKVKSSRLAVLENKLIITVFDSNNRLFHPHELNDNYNEKEKFSVFSIQPYNADMQNIREGKIMGGYTNYFLSDDRNSWAKRVPSFEEIIFTEVYQDVDWVISSKDNNPEHYYIVHKNGNPEEIKTLYCGLDSLWIENHNLMVKIREGVIKEGVLYCYQKKNGKEIPVRAEYNIEKTDKGYIVGYQLDDYDKEYDLIVDPELIFSTYSGSHSDNWGFTSCYDNKRRMISGGICNQSLYPVTEGAYSQNYSGNWDCVITKFDSAGANLLFSTYIGGLNGEMPHSMTVNNNNELVILGTTGSNNFPVTQNAYQPVFAGGDNMAYDQTILYPNGSDLFILTLSAGGDSLIASTFLGGEANDGINYRHEYNNNANILYDGNDSLYMNYGDGARGEVITDKNNNVYIASCTFSNHFPVTQNAFQTINRGGQEGIVCKLDRSLSSLLYSSYIGGSSDDAAYSIDLDSQNQAYICGGTCSRNFPTTQGVYSSVHNGDNTDGFLALISQNGDHLIASTYYGSNKYDQAFFVRTDKNDNPHIFGQTKAEGSTLIHNAQYNRPNSGQFIAKFSPYLDSLCFSTVFGTGNGNINISPSGFTVDVCGRIYIAGWGRIFKYRQTQLGYASLGTTGMETTQGAYMSNTDGMDFYFMCLEQDASALNYATFFGEYQTSPSLGNDHVDGGTSRFDRYGALYQTICASCAGSNELPTTQGAYSRTNNSENCNMGCVKFMINDDFAVADFDNPPIACTNTSVRFNNMSRGDNFLWNFGDNTPLSTLKNPVHTYTSPGLYTVELISSLNQGCIMHDTIRHNILVLSDGSYYLDTIKICQGKPVEIGFTDLNITESDSVRFLWNNGHLLSDSLSANPYATVYSPTLFTLTIDYGECTQTMYRQVETEKLQTNLPDTFNYCSLPSVFEIERQTGVRTIASYTRDFEQTILPGANGITINIEDTLGKYIYIRTYAQGCTSQDSVYLKYSGKRFDFSTTDAGCQRTDNGSAMLIIPDEENVIYHWSFAQENTHFAENLSAGNYALTAIMQNGCTLEIPFTIRVAPVLKVEYDKQNSDCENVCNGIISLNIQGGQTPYLIEWNDEQGDYKKENLCSGEYRYKVIDKSGCKIENTVNITNENTLKVKLTCTENNCAEGCSAKIFSEVIGAKMPVEYLWSNHSAEKNLTDACNGEYTLEVTDALGCKTTGNITVSYMDKMKNFDVWASGNDMYDGENITLYSTLISGMYYQWTPAEGLKNPNSNITEATVYQTTTFTAEVSDRKGCKTSDTVTVYVQYVECSEPNIFVPNAFTPNGDGKNDIVYVSGKYISSIEFNIYDRWGEKVFSTKDLREGWDGNFRNQPCMAGVYFYKLEVHCLGGKTYVKGGDITLIR